MKRLAYIVCATVLGGTFAWADPSALPHPTGNRTTPPTIDTITPLGLSRGATTTLKVAGFNLQGTGKVFFSGSGGTRGDCCGRGGRAEKGSATPRRRRFALDY